MGRAISMTQEDFLQKISNLPNFKNYDYSETIYNGINNKLKIKCIIHNNIFYQLAKSHINGREGCRICLNSSKSKNIDNFIIESISMWGQKYDYSKINYINMNIPVEIRCPIHNHIFSQTPAHHLKMHEGCFLCQNDNKIKKGKKNTQNHGDLSFIEINNKTEDFIKKVEKLFGHNKYNYSETIYIDNNISIKLFCNIHNIYFEQNAGSHLAGHEGCLICQKENFHNLYSQKFLNTAIEKFGTDRFDYSKVDYGDTIGQKIIKIKCIIHNNWFQIKPTIHLRNKSGGCIYCDNERKKSYTTESFIEKAKEVQGNNFDFSKVKYISLKEKVILICLLCDIPHEYLMRADGVLNGRRCQNFVLKNTGATKSIVETMWLDQLKIPLEWRNLDLNIDNKQFNVDALDVNNKIIWEFYGDFYHGNPSIYPPDKINKKIKMTFGELYQEILDREKIFKNNGYTLITIWEKDFRKENNLNSNSTLYPPKKNTNIDV